MPHIADVTKPALTVADLHLFGKHLAALAPGVGLSADEEERCDDLYEVLDDYLTATVGLDWPLREALV